MPTPMMLARMALVGGESFAHLIDISTLSWSAGGGFPGPTAGTITFGSNGDLTDSGFSQTPGATEWHVDNTSAGLGDPYHIKLRRTGGTLATLNHGSSELQDTWLALTSNRIFGITKTGSGTDTWIGVVEISNNGGTTVGFTSGSMTLSVTVDPP